MKIKLDFNNGSFGVATTHNGELIIELSDSPETMKMILKSVYEIVHPTVFLSTLDSDQMSDIVAYAKETDEELIFNNLNFEDVMNYYGVSAVCEWCEANR